ncbi:MAG: type 4 prepilin peptidase 1, Aspartic peptidase family [Thermoleophilia bacterium]|nr:type 4 prepilin peptidase 1, Aspartic peptidase family [Thermoleophilia bacterium]
MEYEPTIAGIVVAALFGLCVGSFLNVVIVRRGHLDWQERGSLDGRSACPKCGHHIAWYENLPLVSWLALRGRCRGCRKPISWRYPLVEALTAGLWAAVAATADGIPELVTGVLLLSVLVPVTFIDLQLRIIPDEINYAAIWLGFACSLGFGPQDRFVAGAQWWWLEVLLASVGAAAFLLLPALITRGAGMGAGDVKLVLALGAFLGAPVAVGLMAGFLVALVPSIFLILAKGIRAGRKTAIPFGPFLAIGGAIGWFVGPAVLDAYLTLGAA